MGTNDSGPLTVAIGGGKGGVGKSIIAANLACAMARVGFRVVVVDADLGAANLHTLFGLDRPGKTLQALVDRRISSLEEAVVATSVRRVNLVPGSGAVAGAANLAHAQKLKIVRHVRALEAEVVVIDCGAGVSFNVLDFFDVADVRLVVATPQLTSLQNAYSFAKGAVYRALQQRAREVGRHASYEQSVSGSETESVREMLGHVAFRDPRLALELAHVVETFGAAVVGNQLELAREANVLHALSRMMRDFLDLDVPVLGALPRSARVHGSVTRRRPFVDQYPSAPETRAMLALAEHVLSTDVVAVRRARARRTIGRRDASSVPPSAPPPSTPAREDGAFPGELTDYLRRHDRVAVDWRAAVLVHGEERAGQVGDVSVGGMSLVVEGRVEDGTQIGILLPDLPGAPSLHGVVRYHGDDGRLGIELVGDTDRRRGTLLVEHARTLDAAE